MSYDYDVFLSYHRGSPVGDWVRNHFHELLEQWLSESVLGKAPRIFIDSQVRTGTEWRDELGHALLHSRVLVPVWSPSYYRAKWCVWEHASMRAREDALGMRTMANRDRLIFPVLFNNNVPPEFGGIQYHDLRQYNLPSESFSKTPEYLDFLREMQTFTKDLAEDLEHAPAWQQGWPLAQPPVDESPAKVGLLRL
jgi:hypothetical protein